MNRWPWRAWTLATALMTLWGATACSEGAKVDAGWQGTVTDSAGVALVRNPVGTTEELPRVLEPELTIIPDASRPETLFGHVADLTADDSGRIYVLDRLAREVRVFEADGSYRGPIGRAGEGPGEFSTFAQSLALHRDTLLVSDRARRVVQRFDLEGEFLSADPFPSSASAGMWLKTGGDALFFRGLVRLTRDDGSWGGRDRLFRATADLSSVDTLLSFEYPESDLGGRGDPRVPFLVNVPTWTPLADGGAAWTHLETERIFLHGPDGILRRVVESPGWVRRETTPAESRALTRLMGERLRMLGSSPELLDNLPVVVPERLPALTSVRAGPDGTLWVQRMGHASAVHPMALNDPAPPTGWGGAIWDILDTEGRFLRRVELPERFRILRFVEDRMYGVQRSELDEEVVMRFRVGQ